MGNIYFSSDYHFCHDREFIWEPRGFKNVAEMNETIIKNHNSIVKPGDDVYLLGDCMLNDNKAGMAAMRRLNGNLHIILGNHDTNEREKLYNSLPNVIETCRSDMIKVDGFTLFLCHYPVLCSNYDEDKPLRRRVISLCGHTHTKDRWSDIKHGLIYHVDVDAHGCKPVSAMDVIKDIKDKFK